MQSPNQINSFSAIIFHLRAKKPASATSPKLKKRKLEAHKKNNIKKPTLVEKRAKAQIRKKKSVSLKLKFSFKTMMEI